MPDATVDPTLLTVAFIATAALIAGWVDAVVEPADTRRLLCRALKVLATKREDLPKRKHANNPL